MQLPRKMESARIAYNREINATGALYNAIIYMRYITRDGNNITKVIITFQSVLNYSLGEIFIVLSS